MENKITYYKESGKVDPFRLAIFTLIFFILNMVLGYIYTVLILLIPVIYFNFLIVIGYAIILGFAFRAIMRLSHVRNRSSRIFVAVIFGLIANYFQWTAFIIYASHGEVPSFYTYLNNLSWIVIPSNFIAAISEINKVGLWSIFGITFNGFMLTFVWVIEAFIIAGGLIFSAIRDVSYPYSEKLEKWYPKFTILQSFEPIYGITKLLPRLQVDTLNTIDKLGPGEASRYTLVHIYYLKEEREQYITIEKVTIDSGGRGKKHYSILAENIQISTGMASEILKKYKYSRDRVGVF